MSRKRPTPKKGRWVPLSPAGKPLFGKKDAAKVIGAMAPSFALASLGGLMGSVGKWAEVDKRLKDVEAKLDRVLYALTGKARPPRRFVVKEKKENPTMVDPATVLYRGLLLGLPFEVNGIRYRPVKGRSK